MNVEEALEAYSCPERASDAEGRVWVCLAPRGHVGSCFMDQIAGPRYDPGDYGGMST